MGSRRSVTHVTSPETHSTGMGMDPTYILLPY